MIFYNNYYDLFDNDSNNYYNEPKYSLFGGNFMEFISQLLAQAIQNTKLSFCIENLDLLAQMLQHTCLIALDEIRAIILDETLDDFTCVEKIICIFERIGSDGGDRHDFG